MGKPTSAVTEGQVEILCYPRENPSSGTSTSNNVDYVSIQPAAASTFTEVNSGTSDYQSGSSFTVSTNNNIYYVFKVHLRDGVVYSIEKVPDDPTFHPKAPDPIHKSRVYDEFPPADIKLVSQSSEANENSIRILSIEPAQATPGKPTKFVIKVAYSLRDINEARLSLSFNNLGPKTFYSIVARDIYAGSGVLEFTVTLTPKDWGNGTAFTFDTHIFVLGGLHLPEYWRCRQDVPLVR